MPKNVLISLRKFCRHIPARSTTQAALNKECLFSISLGVTGFYTKFNVWGSLGLNFEYDGGPIIEIGGPIFLYKLRILEGSTSFREGSVLFPGQ